MTQAVHDIPGGFQYQRRDDGSIAILHAAGGLYMADAAERAMIDRIEALEAEVAALRALLVRALPMLEEHYEYAYNAPVWHCTGHESNTLQVLLPEVRAAIDAAIQKAT